MRTTGKVRKKHPLTLTGAVFLQLQLFIARQECGPALARFDFFLKKKSQNWEFQPHFCGQIQPMVNSWRCLLSVSKGLLHLRDETKQV